MEFGKRISVETRTHVEYIPAKLTEGKVWFVSFYAWDPIQHKLRRKRIKLMRIDGVTARRKFAHEMIRKINRDLENGWSPWTEQLAPKGLHKLSDALETYLEKKLREVDGLNSARTYKSAVKLLKDWMLATNRMGMYAVDFKKRDAQAYLDYCIEVKNLSATTRNNRLTICKAMFGWLQEREYINTNPFRNIHNLKQKEKIRQVIPDEKREAIRQYLMENDRMMLLCCYLMFYTEIRPSEQVRLKVSNLDLERGIIMVPGEAAKNSKVRVVTIPTPFKAYLHQFDWGQYPPNYYLIGKGWEPNKDQLHPKLISSKWKIIRREVGLPMKYQFYSLRDSGIVWMLQQGISPEEVMKQAGHGNLAMTTKYINHSVRGAVDSIRDLSGGF